MPGFQIYKSGAGACTFGAPGGVLDGPAGTQETARLHRYRFETFAPLQGILLFARRAGRPSIEIDVVTTHHSQDEIYTPGKNRWRPIEITFYEAVDGNDRVAQAIYNWHSQVVINLGASLVNANHKRDAQLAMLNGNGFSVWTYAMLGCWVPRVDPSQLDYSDTNIAEITFTLQMDKAVEG